MSSDKNHTSSRTGFVLRLIGILVMAGGFVAYSVLLRRMQTGAGGGGAFGTATPLVVAAGVANAGAVALMLGLAALRDRVTLRVAGLVVGVLLIMLDMPALDALTGPNTAKIIALATGAAFAVTPWFLFVRPKAAEEDKS
jgi:hypothetical protein